MGSCVRYLAIAIASLALGACRNDAPDASLASSSDYSANYTRLQVVSENGHAKSVLVPEACLSNSGELLLEYEAQQLPPGCANAYNLQRMAASKSDLTHAERLSDAPAAPAARAAQRYLDGREEPVLGGGVRKDHEGGKPASNVKVE